MRFGSVCSGIEAASVAWHPLGWNAAFFSEIEPFPCAVLAHHYPDTPNHGDMTKFKEWPDAAIDVLVGGTPCQSFSVAGLRAGLDDPRGNLMLTFGAIADRYRPKWIVWENVPGVLSSNGGRDFGSFLGLLGQLGYGFAYRVLDAQYFGLAQRRKRVFVVGCLGDWRRAAAVLLERQSLSGHPAPRREARQDVAGTIGARTQGGGGLGTDFDCDGRLIAGLELGNQGSGGNVGWFQPSSPCRTLDTGAPPGVALIASTGNVDHCLNAGGMGRCDYETETMVAHALRGEGFDASEDGTGRGTPIVPVGVTLHGSDGCAQFASYSETAQCLRSRAPGGIDNSSTTVVQQPVHAFGVGMQVRRLTPRECARLQGFQDDYLDITFRGKPASDSVKYKAFGNSMAVNCMRWIGTRIQMVEAIEKARAAA